MLKRSHDRKVTNAVTPGGNSAIKNAFGLPAGLSCPGMTSVCESVCYAGKTEKMYPGVRPVLMHNWELLQTDQETQIRLIAKMISQFRADCDKRGADKFFRIHWDGDFFNREYAAAWAYVIRKNPDIQFWVYTRSFTPRLNVVDLLYGIDNLSLYLSVDSQNKEWASVVLGEYPDIRIAALEQTMEKAVEIINIKSTRPGARCPELTGAIPLISLSGSACGVCKLCPNGKSDIRFSISKT